MRFFSTQLRTLCVAAALGFAAQAQAVTVDFQITSTWNNGYNAAVAITNDGPAVSGWTLSFNLGHAIEKASRATLSGSDPYTLKSLDYSANIATNSTETVKYTGAANWSASGLKNCVFNGKACTLLVNGKAIGGSTSSVASSSKPPVASSSSSKPPVASSSSSKPPVASSSSSKPPVASSSSSKPPVASSSSSKPAASSSSSKPSTALKHPGMLTSLATLDAIKARYQAGDQPWTGEVAAMKSSVSSAVLRTPPSQAIECGGHNLDSNGVKVPECDWVAEQGIYAYTYALLGYITGNKTYSDESIKFIMKWSDGTFKGFAEGCPNKGCLNAHLQSGWVAPWFANAAEILRYTYSGWTSANTTAVTNLMNKFYPQVYKDTESSPGNWLHSRIEAHMAIAIWKDDQTMFNAALDHWKKNTPSYFYISSDGSLPPQPNGVTIPTSTFKSGGPMGWWGVKTFTPGMSMETCRDINHQGLGVRSILNSLAMTKNQGVDALAGNDIRERLTTFFEYQANLIEGKKDTGICTHAILFQPPSTLMDKATPISYEMGYTMLKSSSNTLPKTRAAVDADGPIRASRWVQKWETLTHHYVAP